MYYESTTGKKKTIQTGGKNTAQMTYLVMKSADKKLVENTQSDVIWWRNTVISEEYWQFISDFDALSDMFFNSTI